MSSTTQKHKDFVKETMDKKKVIAVPGIGPVYAGHLQKEGIVTASQLFGQFLVCDDEGKFASWFQTTTEGQKNNHKATYKALEAWNAGHFI